MPLSPNAPTHPAPSSQSIMWPNALSWLLMWSSAGLVAAALRGKERVRDQLLARGAVWTAHEAVARRWGRGGWGRGVGAGGSQG